MAIRHIIGFVICVVSSATVADECARGQVSWCKSVVPAAKCGALDHCIATVWNTQTIQLEHKLTDVCDSCQSAVRKIRALLNNEFTEKLFGVSMGLVCSSLPNGEMKTKCESLVENNADGISKLMKSNLPEERTCAAIEMCGTFDFALPEPAPVDASTTIAGANDVCPDCKKLFDDVKAELTDAAYQIKIEDQLKQLCAPLGSLADECKDAIDFLFPQLASYFADSINAAQDCTLLGFCQASFIDSLLLPPMGLGKTAPLAVNGAIACDTCKVIQLAVGEMITSADAQNELDSLIERELCDRFSAAQQTQCKALATFFSKAVLDFLKSHLSGEDVCIAFDMCPKKAEAVCDNKEAISEAVREVKDSETCILCELVVQQIDKQLADNATEAAIRNAAEQACTLLPATVSGECKGFIDNYLEALITLFLKDFDAKTVCTRLGVCKQVNVQHKQTPPPAPKQKATKAAVKTTENLGDDSWTCTICELIMAQLKSALGQNYTEDKVKDELEKICSSIPGSGQQECINMVEQYYKQIYKLLVQLLDPATICQELGFCNSTKATVNMLGAKRCTQGPGYWCSNTEAARECKATKYCVGRKYPGFTGLDGAAGSDEAEVHVALGAKRCTQGPDYWCSSAEAAQECQAMTYCTKHYSGFVGAEENIENEIKQEKVHLLGSEECTWGPDYWCQSSDNAKKCNAVAHCKEHYPGYDNML